MQKLQPTISFNIKTWFANAKGLNTPQAWQQWANNKLWPSDDNIFAQDIPPMMRRRMSPLSKLAVQTAMSLLNENSADYLVFASRHGELHRSTQIIDDLVKDEEASPMAFAQSVHNTAAGLTTIATKLPIPVTSIAAGDNTFVSALIDAWLYLEQHPTEQVLLVDFDEPLPQAYEQYEYQQYQGYAVGFILSHGQQFQLSQEFEQQHEQSQNVITDDYLATDRLITDNNENQYPQGLAFLQNYLTTQMFGKLSSKMQDKQQWYWQRN